MLPELVKNFLASNGQDEQFKEKLYPVVLDLLMHNTAQLYQVLYRIDVREENVKKAFEDHPLAEVAAERICVLIVERQKDKLEWRRKYSL